MRANNGLYRPDAASTGDDPGLRYRAETGLSAGVPGSSCRFSQVPLAVPTRRSVPPGGAPASGRDRNLRPSGALASRRACRSSCECWRMISGPPVSRFSAVSPMARADAGATWTCWSRASPLSSSSRRRSVPTGRSRRKANAARRPSRDHLIRQMSMSLPDAIGTTREASARSIGRSAYCTICPGAAQCASVQVPDVQPLGHDEVDQPLRADAARGQ